MTSIDDENNYIVLVKGIGEQVNTSWIGRVTIMPQENGEIFLDISFTKLLPTPVSVDRKPEANVQAFMVECI